MLSSGAVRHAQCSLTARSSVMPSHGPLYQYSGPSPRSVPWPMCSAYFLAMGQKSATSNCPPGRSTRMASEGTARDALADRPVRPNSYPMGVFTSVFNVTGQPAISIPVHHDAATGLPVCVQIVAAP